MAQWMERFQVGDHVVFTEGYVAEYPMSFRLPKGATGQVTAKTADPGFDRVVEVTLDMHVPQLKPWDNVLHLTPVDMKLNPGFVDNGPAGVVVKRVDHGAMAKAGYYLNPTGGGYSAWEREAGDGDGDVVRISFTPPYAAGIDTGGYAYGDPDASGWHVGRYNEGNGYVESQQDRTLAEAVEFARVIPSPGPGEKQVSGDTVEEIEAELMSAAPSM